MFSSKRSVKKQIVILTSVFSLLMFLISFFDQEDNDTRTTIAIANFGPHESLEEIILGIRKGLAEKGLSDEHGNVRFEVRDVGFDPYLIAPMIQSLRTLKPKVLVALTTPVAQSASKGNSNIPTIFSAITDPAEAGLTKKDRQGKGFMTGAAEGQDLGGLLDLAKKLLPSANRVGLLHGLGESNDTALLKHMRKASQERGIELVSIAVDQASDVPQRILLMKDKVDFIYVGSSGTIQPSLPAIVAAADRMRVPVFNVHSEAVKKHQALASFSVSYENLGISTSKIIMRILDGESAENIPIMHLRREDYKAYVSKTRAKDFGVDLSTIDHNIELMD